MPGAGDTAHCGVSASRSEAKCSGGRTGPLAKPGSTQLPKTSGTSGDLSGPVLDVYQRRWKGRLRHPREYVICADEKAQIQARQRTYPTAAPGPDRPQRVEHDYRRGGAVCDLVA